MTPEELLLSIFGHTGFRPGQREVIVALLAGRSALAVFPTGGGKSLCYQLPALLLDGLTLVISPLIALMKDQVDALQARGVAAARIDSTLSPEELAVVRSDIGRGTLKLLYVAPERLANEKFIDFLRHVNISMVAVDEAHCISEWGHNFRPDYLRLARLFRKWKIRRILALTATATPEVAKEIAREFRIAAKDRVVTSFHRDNLFLTITPSAASERMALLLEKLGNPDKRPAIVYVTLQETAETVAAHLQRAGLRARAYHAGLADAIRSEVQHAFLTDAISIIVATIAFGMGVDKANVRSVYHFNLPKTLENYQQEIGRAGRDDAPAHCELLACGDDLRVLENFILGDTPTRPALLHLCDHFLRQGAEFSISRYDLARTSDVKQVVLETALTYLEKEHILEPSGTFYTRFEVGFTRDLAQVLNGHSPARQKILRKLFDSGIAKGRKLLIELEAAQEALEWSSAKVLAQLTELEASEEVVVLPKKIRHRYRLLVDPQIRTPTEIADWLLPLFQERETADLARLASVVALAETSQCITSRLLRHFGERIGLCGHCANCLEPHGKRKLPRTRRPPITTAQIAQIHRVIAEKNPALRSSRALTRFLCGLPSPATQRDRLTRHEAFGLLGNLPFQEVLAQTDSMLID